MCDHLPVPIFDIDFLQCSRYYFHFRILRILQPVRYSVLKNFVDSGTRARCNVFQDNDESIQFSEPARTNWRKKKEKEKRIFGRQNKKKKCSQTYILRTIFYIFEKWSRYSCLVMKMVDKLIRKISFVRISQSSILYGKAFYTNRRRSEKRTKGW